MWALLATLGGAVAAPALVAGEGRMWYEDESGGLVEVRVDLDGLGDFAECVRTDTEGGLRPGSERVRADLGGGVRFGARSASGYVHAAKQRYQESLLRAVSTLAGYVQAGQVLADVAEQVAAEYRSADALSAARVAEVGEAFAAALAVAQARLVVAQSGGAGPVRYE